MTDPNSFPATNSPETVRQPSVPLPEWIKEAKQDSPRPKTGSIPDWMRETLKTRRAKTKSEEVLPVDVSSEASDSKRYYPTDQDPKKAEGALEAIRKLGLGWKLHLNFDPNDPKNVAAVEVYLSQTDPRLVRGFKIGRNGGQSGKEATVYIGSKDQATKVAKEIEEGLGNILREPEGDGLKSDIVFTPKVIGRFDISRFDPDFIQYGFRGFPMLKVDANNMLWAREKYSPEEASQRANRVLIERYGTFYIGTQDARVD